MHTVAHLERALSAAREQGFKIRVEWLGGSGGGDCEFKGQKWIFLDLAHSPAEQLEQVRQALARAREGGVRADGGPFSPEPTA